LARSTLIAIIFIFIFADPSLARRAIPDDNLAYPVLITLKTANGTLGYGSGVYLSTDNAMYLVTAKHVLDPGLPDATQRVPFPDMWLELLSYSKHLPNPTQISITVDNGKSLKL
jgi:hypothetical protein